LLGEVVVVAAAQVRQGGAAPMHLKARGAEKQLAQVAERLVALVPVGVQSL
jgi:hypothetical protein